MIENMSDMVTQVGIVGAGPAGLLLAHLLAREGIESVVVEARSRAHLERRIRAGVLEQGTTDLLDAAGVGERMRREGMVHHGIELRFGGRGHRIDFAALTGGRGITVYGQQEVVKDLLAAREAAGALPLFECADVELLELDGDRPAIRFSHAGARHELRCDVIAGCDGFHGVCRPSIPDGALDVYEREYPFGWLGILAEVAPSTEELIYARHERGFALHSMRSPELSRFYLQCEPEADPARLARRAASGRSCASRLALDLERGPDHREGRDADALVRRRADAVRPAVPRRRRGAHRPADRRQGAQPRGRRRPRARRRARATTSRRGDDTGLRAYSDTCLRRVWRAEHFSWWMTSMLHRFPDGAGFEERLQRSQLEYVARLARRPRRRWPRTTSAFS